MTVTGGHAPHPRRRGPAGWTEARRNRKARLTLIDPITEAVEYLTLRKDGRRRGVGSRRVAYRLMEAGHAATAGKTKDDLIEQVTDTIAVMREVGLIHPDLITDGRWPSTSSATGAQWDGFWPQVRPSRPPPTDRGAVPRGLRPAGAGHPGPAG